MKEELKVLFVSSSRKGEGISPFILSQGESLRLIGIIIDYYLIEGQGINNYLKSILKIRSILKSKDYDIIHAHYGMSGIVSRLSFSNKKVVVSFLGDDLMGSVKSNGTYSRFSVGIVFLNKLFARYFFDINIVKSESLAMKLFRETKFHIIPNGVDITKFSPVPKNTARKEIGIDQSGKYLLFLGDPQRPVKNYILFESCRIFIKELKEYKILLLKGVNKEQANLYYNAADICILSSLHEGSPNVVKEAMACNSIIVSTDVGDVSWLFDNIDGYYISKKDPISLARTIDKAALFDRASYRPNGRERILTLGLDSNSIAQKISEVYRSIFNN